MCEEKAVGWSELKAALVLLKLALAARHTGCVLASQHCKQQGCQQYNDTIVISARTASWSVQLDLIRAKLPVEGDAVTDLAVITVRPAPLGCDDLHQQMA